MVLACRGQRNSSGVEAFRGLWESVGAPVSEGPSELLNRASLTMSAGDLNTTGASGFESSLWGGFRLFGGLYTVLGKRTFGSTLEKSGKGWLSWPFLRTQRQCKQLLCGHKGEVWAVASLPPSTILLLKLQYEMTFKAMRHRWNSAPAMSRANLMVECALLLPDVMAVPNPDLPDWSWCFLDCQQTFYCLIS